MPNAHPPEPPLAAKEALGDAEAYPLLRDLVGLATTNLEDPAHERWEKPHYVAAARYLVSVATKWGLRARIFDPLTDLPGVEGLHGIPRPNVIVDLDVGAPERILIMSHYDVVPVPAEQRARWKTPPHELTFRSDGLFYGRGSADDLGSGVVPSLIAVKRLQGDRSLRRNIRLLICCDEETGGSGGIDGLKAHDERLALTDPERLLAGEVALIPDGDPHATAGSSGVLFLDGTFARPVELPRVVAFGESLVALQSLAEAWTSIYPSPDWPDHGAPAPTITGRATVTKFDATGELDGPAGRSRVGAIHAETDATNQIAQSVTLVVHGAAPQLSRLSGDLALLLPPPFRLETARATALTVPAGSLALSVVGTSAHAGYPHRGHNPVPATLQLLDRALRSGLLDSVSPLAATFGVDLRLIPEMPMDVGVQAALDYARSWSSTHDREARVDAPPDRGRGGYALRSDHPALLKMERILASVFGVPGIFGEYGGTDASSLLGLRTPRGEPLPALVFGLMGRTSHIHEAEENLDPIGVARVTETIRRFIAEP
ncbi:MAG: M20/M25/M40 family metallo-hydrolase [Thermoplasmata archaeon]|nr:M20/M25/M40 family metallo-hydrolase [Thermoplasmata archaeon]